jgi:hypothetical protein
MSLGSWITGGLGLWQTEEVVVDPPVPTTISATYDITTEIQSLVTATYDLRAAFLTKVERETNIKTVVFGPFSTTAPAQRIQLIIQR